MPKANTPFEVVFFDEQTITGTTRVSTETGAKVAGSRKGASGLVMKPTRSDGASRFFIKDRSGRFHRTSKRAFTKWASGEERS